MKTVQKICLIIVLLFISGCITTKPNPIYQGPLPSRFTVLEQGNPLLATEIRKLPEIQDGVSPSEEKALEDLINLYESDQKAFDDAFQKMYQVGIPEVRKYCTPLQALFWMAEDENLREGDNPLVKYSLQQLLNESWRDDRRWDDFNTVTDRINAPELFDCYIRNYYSYIWDHRKCQTPHYTFNRKKGCCVCLAFLGKHFLEKAGYKTFIRHIVGNRDMHGVLVVKSDGMYNIVVDYTGFAGGRNTMSGPFNSMSEVDNQIKKVTGPSVLKVRNIYSIND